MRWKERQVICRNPRMAEDRRKWRFLCKMYGILTAQWMLTFIISTIITFLSPIPNLLIGKLKITASVVIVTVCLSLILLRLLYSYGKQVGLNLILLGLLSLSVSIGVGASCGNISDKAGTFVRDLLVLISVSFSSIFWYTLGAIKNNLEFNLARPWRLSCFHISVLVSFEQIFVPYAFAAGFCVIIFSFMIYSAVERLLEKL
ncbi:BI1-like protein [Quillaja saponaria]|uniref:BI1-like protein n=1 Tax=Quillaja saponaria TaxID=32244 RepID=A0AAD7PHH2_QUISA|nr:BI1-like protein [Quillaja saponaria]